MRLFRLQIIPAFYGPSPAFFGVDLAADEGGVVALLGRNRMGKSTSIKVICSVLRQSGGSVVFIDQDLEAVAPHVAAKTGLGLLPGGRRWFPNLTGHETLIAAALSGPWGLGSRAVR